MMTTEDQDKHIRNVGLLASIIPPQPATLIKQRLFRRTFYEGTNAYQFCPFCASRVKRGENARGAALGLLQKELDPLEVHVFKCLYQYGAGEQYGIVLFETHWYCGTCRKYVTDEDFEKEYAEEPTFQKHSKLIDLNDQNALDNF